MKLRHSQLCNGWIYAFNAEQACEQGQQLALRKMGMNLALHDLPQDFCPIVT